MTEISSAPGVCSNCRTVIAPGLVVCPSCHSLVYAEELKKLAVEAGQFNSENRVHEELSSWRRALELLPDGSTQKDSVQAKIDALVKKIDSTPALKKHDSKVPSVWLGLGTIGIVLWKFKFVLFLLLTKAKLLLLGLTKAQTFFSMILAFGVYWGIWGWKFALGFVLSIYIHEMGHVFALKKFGIPTSLPIFIPGLGAFIRLKQTSINPIEEARIGLAGPIAGGLAAIVCYLIFLGTGEMFWAALARVGAWINLFNLLAIVPLDGGRGFRALSKHDKWIAVAGIGLMWFVTHEGLLFLLLLAGVFNAMTQPPNSPSDKRALWEYLILIGVLSMMTLIKVAVH